MTAEANTGGLLLTDQSRIKSDVKMIEQAVKKNWKIPENLLNSLPTILGGIIATTADARVKIGVSRVLVAMHGQNLQSEDNIGKPSQTINVGVSVNAGTQDRRDRILAIADRVRARRIP